MQEKGRRFRVEVKQILKFEFEITKNVPTTILLAACPGMLHPISKNSNIYYS
jgi:hypothetical protein